MNVSGGGLPFLAVAASCGLDSRIVPLCLYNMCLNREHRLSWLGLAYFYWAGSL
jgi:hypothetical protein